MRSSALNKSTWNKYASDWATGHSPFRPHKSEVGLYEKCIQSVIHKNKSRKIKALLLGATPELRDLLYKHKAQVTIVDNNPNMARAMTELLEISDGKEKIIISNWTDIDFPANHFDIILCDHGLHYIFFEEWDSFFKKINGLLTSNGHVAFSFLTAESIETITAKTTVERYNTSHFNMEMKWLCLYLMWNNLKKISNKKYYINTREINQQLKSLLNKRKIDVETYNFLSLPEILCELKAVVPPKEVIDKKINEYFNLKSIKVSTDFQYLSCHKIYFASKK